MDVGTHRSDAAVRSAEAAHQPGSVYFEVSNYCNSLCETCPLTFYGNGSPKNMPFADFERIVSAAPNLRRAVLHGIGEPLLNPQLPKMIAYLKARNIHVLFNSNALILTARRQQQLVDAGLDEFRASLDASTPETYLKVRGVPGFQRVIGNLTAFVRLKQRLGADLPRLSLWFTTMRENLPELPGVVELAGTMGIREVYVQRLVYFGDGLAVEAQSLFKRLQRDEQDILERCARRCTELGIQFSAAGATQPLPSLAGSDESMPWQRCQRPWTNTYVTATGDVLPCCFVPFVARDVTPFALGNAYQQPLTDIWNASRYQEFRRKFLSEDPPTCCAGCGAKWST